MGGTVINVQLFMVLNGSHEVRKFKCVFMDTLEFSYLRGENHEGKTYGKVYSSFI